MVVESIGAHRVWPDVNLALLKYGPTPQAANVPGLPAANASSSYNIGRSNPGVSADREIRRLATGWDRYPEPESRLSSYQALLRAANQAAGRDFPAEAATAVPGDDVVVRRGFENLPQGTRYSDRDSGYGRKTPRITNTRRRAAGSGGFNPANRKLSKVQVALNQAIENASPQERVVLEQYRDELAGNIAYTDTAQDVVARDQFLRETSDDPSLAKAALREDLPSGNWRRRGASSWTENDNASVGAEPHQRIAVPVRQADGQWKISSGPRKGQDAVGYLDPAQIVETRSQGEYQNRRIDPDSTAAWDKEAQVSLGGLAREIRNEQKTQVIDNVTLNALAAEGRVKRLPPEEIEQRRITSKGNDSAVATLERTVIRDGVLLTNGQGQELLAHIEYDAAGAPTGRVISDGVAFAPRPDTTLTQVGKYPEKEIALIYEPKGKGSRTTTVEVPNPDNPYQSIKEERTLYRIGNPMNRDFDAIRGQLKPFTEPGMGPFLDHKELNVDPNYAGGIRRNAEKLPAGMTFEQLVNSLAAGNRMEDPAVRDAMRDILAEAAVKGEMPTNSYGDKPMRGTVESLYSGINPKTGRNPEGVDTPAVTAGKQLRAALQEYVDQTGQGVPTQEAVVWADAIGSRWGVSGSEALKAAADPANDPGRALFPREYEVHGEGEGPFFTRVESTGAQRLSQAIREKEGGREVDLFAEMPAKRATSLSPETYVAEITGQEPGYQFRHSGQSDSDFLTADASAQSGPVEQVIAGQKPYASKVAEAIRARAQQAPEGRPQLRQYRDFAQALGEEVGSERQELAMAEMARRVSARNADQVAVAEEASSLPPSMDAGVMQTEKTSQFNAPESPEVPNSSVDVAAAVGTPERETEGFLRKRMLPLRDLLRRR